MINASVQKSLQFNATGRPCVPRSCLLPGQTVNGPPWVVLKAAAVDGTANKALIEILAWEFRAYKAEVSIISGQRMRLKNVDIRHCGSCPDALSDILHGSSALTRRQPGSGL